MRVPALDQTISDLRNRFHLALKPNGIRPHVTSLIPFLPAAELGEDGALPALRALCAGLAPFDVCFARTARFRRVLYLAPEPAEPFIAFTHAITAAWPQAERYAGARKEVVPHLTVTTSGPPRLFDAVARALEPNLPVNVRIDAAQVYLFDGRQWTEHASFAFGS